MHYLSVSNPFHTLVIKLCETVGHCSVILLRYVFFKPPLSENHCFVCLRILSHQFLLFVVRNSPQQVTSVVFSNGLKNSRILFLLKHMPQQIEEAVAHILGLRNRSHVKQSRWPIWLQSLSVWLGYYFLVAWEV